MLMGSSCEDYIQEETRFVYLECIPPRFSPDGKKVIIDSPHGGDGRQLHLIDIEGVAG